MPTTKICDECSSPFFAESSRMAYLCPECAWALYDHDNCAHDDLPCIRCGWDGSRSRYVFSILGIEPRKLETPADALALLAELGATPWLIRHHELVVEAATLLCDGFERKLFDVRFNREHVLLGAALHDVGKVVVPEEMREPGHRHEQEGRLLLIRNNVPSDLTAYCVTHAEWASLPSRHAMDDLLVALADKLWKGKRDEALEKRVLTEIVGWSPHALWDAFDKLDALCEAIAADGPDRLARSNV